MYVAIMSRLQGGWLCLQVVHKVRLSVAVESLREDVTSALRDEQRVFKLSRETTVLCYRRPVVRPRLITPRSWYNTQPQRYPLTTSLVPDFDSSSGKSRIWPFSESQPSLSLAKFLAGFARFGGCSAATVLSVNYG